MFKKPYLVIFSIFIFALLSCNNKSKVELPFEDDKIVAILADLHFAKSASTVHSKEIRDSMRSVYEAQVFTIHKITKAEFNELKRLLETDLKFFYEIEKKVHKYLKDVQNEKV